MSTDSWKQASLKKTDSENSTLSYKSFRNYLPENMQQLNTIVYMKQLQTQPYYVPAVQSSVGKHVDM